MTAGKMMRAYEGTCDCVRVRDDDAAPWRPLPPRFDLAVGSTARLAWGGFSRESEQLAVALLADHFADEPVSAVTATIHAIDAGLLDTDAQPTFDELAIIMAPAFLLEVVSRLAPGGWFLYAWQIVQFIERLRPESMKRDTWPAVSLSPMESSCPASN